ncbi:MAG: DNA-3-methyladenine glycosylase [Peptococcaceae bacterium]|nr:DNA-3-methyladenine glycosylase [Peptococcaceae bacterium]
MQKLTRDFYERDTLTVAKALLGKVVVHQSEEGAVSGMIVETEGYMGREDPAAHSYKGKPQGRVNVQYGPGGFAYVYLIYGMYHCLNVVTQKEGRPECVLIRALEPLEGLELMKKRRRGRQERHLCDGPGKLCSALGINMDHYGEDLCGGRLYIAEGVPVADHRVAATPRIHIDYANEAAAWPWRFIVKDSPFLSFPGGPGRQNAAPAAPGMTRM